MFSALEKEAMSSQKHKMFFVHIPTGDCHLLHIVLVYLLFCLKVEAGLIRGVGGGLQLELLYYLHSIAFLLCGQYVLLSSWFLGRQFSTTYK